MKMKGKSRPILIIVICFLCLLTVINGIFVWVYLENSDRIRMGEYYGKEIFSGFSPTIRFEGATYITDDRFAPLYSADGLVLDGEIVSRVLMHEKPVEDNQVNSDMVGLGIYRLQGDSDHIYIWNEHLAENGCYQTYVKIELWEEELEKNGF